MTLDKAMKNTTGDKIKLVFRVFCKISWRKLFKKRNNTNIDTKTNIICPTQTHVLFSPILSLYSFCKEISSCNFCLILFPLLK